MKKLFAVLLGGRAKGCNTELHDTVFVVGDSLEATYPQLINKWFGSTRRLHIDAAIELSFVDGHEITVSSIPDVAKTDKHLFFVNFGAYKPNYFGELHEVDFYVASSKTEALARAKQKLCTALFQPHCDDNLLVDDIALLNKVDKYYIHLKQSTQQSELKVSSHYIKLDTPEILGALVE